MLIKFSLPVPKELYREKNGEYSLRCCSAKSQLCHYHDCFCREIKGGVLPFFGHFLEVSQDKGLMKNFQRLWPSVKWAGPPNEWLRSCLLGRHFALSVPRLSPLRSINGYRGELLGKPNEMFARRKGESKGWT